MIQSRKQKKTPATPTTMLITASELWFSVLPSHLNMRLLVLIFVVGLLSPGIKGKLNGKRCYRCDISVTCDSIMQCEDDKDHCGTAARVLGLVPKGCISKQMCDFVPASPLGKIHCCQGDLCNGATSTSMSLLLLLAPVLTTAFL